MPAAVTARLPFPQLARLSNALDLFKNICSTMPLSQLQAFLLVANDPGKSLGELSAIAGIKQSTLSRYLLDWSDKTRTGAPGYRLIAREVDPEELRRNSYSLTAKGYALLNKVSAALEA